MIMVVGEYEIQTFEVMFVVLNIAFTLFGIFVPTSAHTLLF